MKNSNDTIGNRTCHLPAWSAVKIIRCFRNYVVSRHMCSVDRFSVTLQFACESTLYILVNYKLLSTGSFSTQTSVQHLVLHSNLFLLTCKRRAVGSTINSLRQPSYVSSCSDAQLFSFHPFLGITSWSICHSRSEFYISSMCFNS